MQMHENKLPKNILWIHPGGQLECGRPKSKWIDVVEEDTRKLGCRNWRVDAQDTGRSRHLLEEVKATQGCRTDDDFNDDDDHHHHFRIVNIIIIVDLR